MPNTIADVPINLKRVISSFRKTIAKTNANKGYVQEITVDSERPIYCILVRKSINPTDLFKIPPTPIAKC